MNNRQQQNKCLIFNCVVYFEYFLFSFPFLIETNKNVCEWIQRLCHQQWMKILVGRHKYIHERPRELYDSTTQSIVFRSWYLCFRWSSGCCSVSPSAMHIENETIVAQSWNTNKKIPKLRIVGAQLHGTSLPFCFEIPEIRLNILNRKITCTQYI